MIISQEEISCIDQEKNRSIYGYEIPDTTFDSCFFICSICKSPNLSSIRAFRRTLRRRGVYRCSPCISRSPEGRAQRSKQSKEAWGNPEIASIILKKNIDISRSEEGRAQRSKQSKEAWTNNEKFIECQKERTRTMFQSQKHRELVSKRNKEDYKSNPEKYIKEKVSALHTEESRKKHREALNKPEYKELHSRLAKERFKNPEYKAKISKGLENFPRGGKMSSPEEQVKNILDSLEIGYTYNKALGPYNFDFYIDSYDLFIEVQGEYWHTLPNNERRDRSKYTYLRSSSPDSKIIYIWDYDFLTGAAESKIKESVILNSTKLEDFEFSDLSFKEITPKESKKFLSMWHYAQSGKQPKFSYAAILNDEIIAVAKFGPVSRVEIATSINGNSKNTFELDRFCIHPFRQKKNFASYFLSKAEKAFFAYDTQVKYLVAFSDTTFGHDGSIYKATNWKEVSRTRPDYVYVNSDGWMMHKKSLYNQAVSVHMNEADYAKTNGWKKVFGKEKIKFVKCNPSKINKENSQTNSEDNNR